MIGRYVRELVEGSPVDSVFLMRGREMRATRTGDAYLALELGDRSGCMPAVLFRPSAHATAIPSGSVVRATGTVTSFRGVRRISLEGLRAAETWEPEDLVASGTRPRDELVSELKSLVGSIGDRSLRRLLGALFSDKPFFERFCRCPASQEAHHAHLGGLLEHTVSVAATCAAVADRYPEVDRDLLVAAALVHDIGAVDAFEFQAGITCNDRGRLLGLQTLGLLRLNQAAARCRCDLPLVTRLEHAVLACGTDVGETRPVTAESLVLSRLDQLDCRAASHCESVSAAMRVEEEWVRAGDAVLYAPSAA